LNSSSVRSPRSLWSAYTPRGRSSSIEPQSDSSQSECEISFLLTAPSVSSSLIVTDFSIGTLFFSHVFTRSRFVSGLRANHHRDWACCWKSLSQVNREFGHRLSRGLRGGRRRGFLGDEECDSIHDAGGEREPASFAPPSIGRCTIRAGQTRASARPERVRRCACLRDCLDAGALILSLRGARGRIRGDNNRWRLRSLAINTSCRRGAKPRGRLRRRTGSRPPAILQVSCGLSAITVPARRSRRRHSARHRCTNSRDAANLSILIANLFLPVQYGRRETSRVSGFRADVRA